MSARNPQVVVCTYRVRPGKAAAFRALLRRHWPTLKRLGLVENAPRMLLRGLAPDSRNDFIEIFAWKPAGFERAHRMPEVLAIWEPMEQLCEARGGRAAMEFPHFAPLPLR
jgi:hypothetical protein